MIRSPALFSYPVGNGLYHISVILVACVNLYGRNIVILFIGFCCSLYGFLFIRYGFPVILYGFAVVLYGFLFIRNAFLFLLRSFTVIVRSLFKIPPFIKYFHNVRNSCVIMQPLACFAAVLKILNSLCRLVRLRHAQYVKCRCHLNRTDLVPTQHVCRLFGCHFPVKFLSFLLAHAVVPICKLQLLVIVFNSSGTYNSRQGCPCTHHSAGKRTADKAL